MGGAVANPAEGRITVKRKILILLGHPDKSGFCGEMADTYETAARAAGHEVDRMNLGEMRFDPILHHGYRERQELEPDLLRFQELVKACDHFVVIHPVWWVGMPALLKGLFDRAWLPGSAFRYMKLPSGERSPFWHRMFRGKTARIILASGTNPWMVWLLPGNVNAQLKWGILWFAGFSVCTTWFGSSENIPPERRAGWLAKIRRLGAAAR